MKKIASILVGLLALPLFALAAPDDAVFAIGQQITVGSNTFVIADRQLEGDSVTVNSGNFTVTTTGGTHLVITSADRVTFTVSPEQYKTGFDCTTSESKLSVDAGPDVSTTITITPLST